MKWQRLPITTDDPQAFRDAVRLNSLGSLFFFAGFVLKKTRLAKLHWQMCETVETEDLHLVLEMPMSHFKALDIRTAIPTPDGFKLMGHIHVGDTVLGADGLPCKVIGVSPHYFSGECYEVVFNTGDKIICDAGHLWETQSLEDYNNSHPKVYRAAVRTTKQIAAKIDYCAQRNHRVRLARPIQLPEAELPIHPYVLGCWLGDGTSSSASITIGTKDDEFMAGEIRRCGEALTKTNEPLRWHFYDGKRRGKYDTTLFSQRLRRLSLLNNKHVPEIYMRASASQRLALLQGLMDTDGSVSKTGQSTFSNTNKRLVEQVRELACSLGLKPHRIGTYKARLNREYVGYFHVVQMYSYKDNPVFRMPRKIARLNERSVHHMQGHRHIVGINRVKSRYVRCIMVDSSDSLFLAGDAFIPTHNTTVCTEALSMWWALSFTERDEELMRGLGYDDAWIRWMKIAHDQNARTLITHETDTRVVEMGKAIDGHYLHNDIFRYAFSDLIPDGSLTWNNHSKFQKRNNNSPGDMTTATFAMRSVGQALQGIHATGIINDDSVGRAAQTNLLQGDGRIMEGIYRWWKQTTTRFDPAAFTKTGLGRQLVNGNRWAHRDLNYYIREFHPDFKIESHDAEGGCCEVHPVHGEPIFPEEWSMERLMEQKRTLTHEGKSYDYINFYRNKTTLPEDALFKPDWIRKYICVPGRPDLDEKDFRNFLALRHIVADGDPIPDLNAGVLHKRMIVILADPKRRRQNHVVLVAGYEPERDWIYLLKLEVGKPMFGDLLDKIYKLAQQMNLVEFFTSKQAAEALKFYVDERNRRDAKNSLAMYELDADDTDAAQSLRIEGLQSLFKGKQFWCHPSFKEFFAEYESYPGGPVEVLNAVGMIPSTLEGIRRKDLAEWYLSQRNAFASRSTGAGGY